MRPPSPGLVETPLWNPLPSHITTSVRARQWKQPHWLHDSKPPSPSLPPLSLPAFQKPSGRSPAQRVVMVVGSQPATGREQCVTEIQTPAAQRIPSAELGRWLARRWRGRQGVKRRNTSVPKGRNGGRDVSLGPFLCLLLTVWGVGELMDDDSSPWAAEGVWDGALCDHGAWVGVAARFLGCDGDGEWFQKVGGVETVHDDGEGLWLMESFFRLHFDVPWRRVLATEPTGRRDTISGFAGGQDIRRRCGSLRLLPSPGRSMSGQRKHGSLETRHNFEPPTVMADDIPYRKTVSLHSLYNHQPAPGLPHLLTRWRERCR